MIARTCDHAKRIKRGKNRKGQQRWKCSKCGVMFTSDEQRPLGDMRIDLDDAVKVLGMLLEGMSIRACERITGMNIETICDLIVTVGENCDRWLKETVVGVETETVELDEIWSFVRLKSKTQERLGRITENEGDSWTWLAIAGQSKLILAHSVGLRDAGTCEQFLAQVNRATSGRCQVTSDGLGLYTHRVPWFMGTRVDFAQLVKNYSNTQDTTRYSPAKIISAEKTPRFGNPDEDRISTSYSERFNLSMRMNIRRFTRLTNAHSKSYRHHAAMVSLFIAWYNFVRPHMTLGKGVTPAMAAGLTSFRWDLASLLRAAA